MPCNKSHGFNNRVTLKAMGQKCADRRSVRHEALCRIPTFCFLLFFAYWTSMFFPFLASAGWYGDWSHGIDDMVQEMRTKLFITQEEAGDETLKDMLRHDDYSTWYVSVEQCLSMIEFGEEVVAFLDGEGMTPSSEKSYFESFSPGLVDSLAYGCGWALEILGQIPGGWGYFFNAVKFLIEFPDYGYVETYGMVADAMTYFNKRSLLQEYVQLRDRGAGPEDAYEDLYSVYDPIIDEIKLAYKYTDEVLLGYFENWYHAYKLYRDQAYRESVGKGYATIAGYLESKALSLTASVPQISAGPYVVGQSISVSFVLTNTGDELASLDTVTLGGRLVENETLVCPDDSCPDFTLRSSVSISSDDQFTYQGQFSPSRPGVYHFFPAVETTANSHSFWNVNIPSPDGQDNTFMIVVAECPIPTIEGDLSEGSRSILGEYAAFEGHESVYAQICNSPDGIMENANVHGAVYDSGLTFVATQKLDTTWSDSLGFDSSFNTVYACNPGLDSDGVFEVVSATDESGSLRSTSNAKAYYFSYDGLNDHNAGAIGLEQWVDYLEQVSLAYRRIGRLTIFCHGNEQIIKLSEGLVLHYNQENLPANGYTFLDVSADAFTRQNLLRLRQILAPGAHILLFACRTAASENGRSMVQELANLANATVHANANYTGDYSPNGDSDWTLDFVRSPEEDLVRPAPTNLSGTSSGDDFVYLAWSAPQGGIGGGPEGYRIYYGTSAQDPDQVLDIGDKLNHTVEGLSRGQTYYFSVAAYYPDNEESSSSGVVSVTIPLVPAGPVVEAKDITALEYFFDADPGMGQGTPLCASPGQTIAISTTLDVSELSFGLHRLYVRAQNEDGEWGIPQMRHVLVVHRDPRDPDPILNQVEAFFDTDPEMGHGTSLSVTPTPKTTVSEKLDVSGLSIGLHRLYVRAQDELGNWGIPQMRQVLIQKSDPEGTPTATTAAEYFFDADPGMNEGTSLGSTMQPEMEVAKTLDVSGLSLGLHRLYVRAQDELGTWGIPQMRQVLVQKSDPNGPALNIAQLQYFFDTDPGFGISGIIAAPLSSSVTVSANLGLETLDPGNHRLFVRAKDEAGTWGIPQSADFEIKADTDRDAIIDEVEDVACTETNNADTDGDGLDDGEEDANKNGVRDPGETDACKADTDGDTLPDGWEVSHGLDPFTDDRGADTDGDGHTNLDEYAYGTDPADEESNPADPGDINNDNKFDLSDIEATLQIMTGKIPAAEIHPEADMNNDNRIDLIEASGILINITRPGPFE